MNIPPTNFDSDILDENAVNGSYSSMESIPAAPRQEIFTRKQKSCASPANRQSQCRYTSRIYWERN